MKAQMDQLLLVVGGQKCGTATLAADLRAVRGFNVPDHIKEAAGLEWRLPRPVWRHRYLRQWSVSRPGDVLVDVSTTYMMMPSHDPIRRDELSDMFSSVTVLCVLRNPVERALSHHHHDTVLGLCSDSLEDALTEESDYLAHSCYGRQLRPWVEAFGPENVIIWRFEDYVRGRQEHLQGLCDRLNVDADGLGSIDAESVHNRTTGREEFGRLLARVVRSSMYRRYARRILPQNLRSSAKSALSSEAQDRVGHVSEATRSRMERCFRADEVVLRALHPDAPSWDGPR